MEFLWVFLGSGLGGAARYAASAGMLALTGPGFPYGTLVVNTLGSFLITVIMEVSAGTRLIPPELRLFLTTGIMGGFTTYSTFNYETLRFFQAGAWGQGLVNVVLTVLGCAVAGGLGLALTRLAGIS